MKILKFNGVMLLVLALTLVVPFYYLNHIYTGNQQTLPLTEDPSELSGLPKYMHTLFLGEDSTAEIKNAAEEFISEFTNIIEFKIKNFRTLMLIMGIILGIFVTTTGIALISTKKKLIGNALITSGIITILGYISTYIIFILYFLN